MFSFVYYRRRNKSFSPLTKCFIKTVNSKGPVLGNHLGVQELPIDCHIPIDVSPIINKNDRENTPPNNKSKKLKSCYRFLLFTNFVMYFKIFHVLCNFYTNTYMRISDDKCLGLHSYIFNVNMLLFYKGCNIAMC